MRADSTDLRGLRPGILGLAVTCALAMTQAQAVGMGGIEVKSKLNEPFVAEIPLNVDYSGQMDDMVVHLASPEEFERVGLERPHDMSANLNFKVTRNARGEAVVLVTTPQRMTDPYVSFLLEAEWGNGKMVREYTAMLEPPHTAEVPHAAVSAPTVASTPLPAPAVSPPVVKAVEPEQHPGAPDATPATATAPAAAPEPPSPAPTVAEQPPPPQAAPEPAAPEPAASEQAAPEPATPEPQPTPEPVASAPPPVPETQNTVDTPPPPAEAPPAPASGSITVGHGQTLSAIAGQVDASGASLNRVMIALQRANPDAFVDNNINRLKAGAVLRVPDADAMRAITADEANALVHVQVESWRRGTQAPPQLQPGQAAASAAKPAAAQAVAASAGASASPGDAHSAAADDHRSAAASGHAPRPHGAHLEILPPVGNAGGHSQSGSAEGGAGSELRAELAQTREELSSRKAEIADLKAHVSDLEKIKTDSQKMLSVKDSQLAALQQRLAELEKKDAEAGAAGATALPVASAAASTAADATTAASAAASTASTAASPAASASAAASPVSPAVPKPSAPAPHATAPAPQEPGSPWYLQPFVLVGGGLILFAGLLGVMLRRPGKPESPPRRRSFDVASLAAAGVPDARSAVAPEPEAQPSYASSRVTTEEPAYVPPVASAEPAYVPPQEESVHAAVDPEPQAEPVPLHEPEVAEPEPPAAVAAAVPAIPTPPDGKWTVPSRIEAARAYIENGDVDGARSMLEAALIDGNAAQQEEAFKLLDMIDSW